MLSSIAGLPGRGGLEALKAAGAVPVSRAGRLDTGLLCSADPGQGVGTLKQKCWQAPRCCGHSQSFAARHAFANCAAVAAPRMDPLFCDGYKPPTPPPTPHPPLPQELMRLLKESPFHVRKEAAFALANICADGGGGTGARPSRPAWAASIVDMLLPARRAATPTLASAPAPACTAGNPDTLNWLFAADREALKAMVSLMRSADMDAARLGLQARPAPRPAIRLASSTCAPPPLTPLSLSA